MGEKRGGKRMGRGGEGKCDEEGKREEKQRREDETGGKGMG